MPEPDRPASKTRARTSRTRRRGSPQTPTPATVWTCGPTPTDPDAVWPTPIVETIVASFSKPGAQVTLLPWPDTTRVAEPGYPDGLITHAPGTEPDDELADALTAIDDLHRQSRVRRLPAAQTVTPAPRLGDGDPDTDLIITSVPPHQHADPTGDAVALFAARLLRVGGILIALTHSDTTTGQLTDVTGPIVAAAQQADLLYLQHIIALHTPIRHGHIDIDATPNDAGTDEYDGARHRARVRGLPAPHRRVHSDVLVFAQPHDHQPQPGAVPETGVLL